MLLTKPKIMILAAFILVSLSVASIYCNGLNFDIDFVGGSNVYIEESTASAEELKSQLKLSGEEYSLVETANGFIKISLPPEVEVGEFMNTLGVSDFSYEKIGPKVGSDLLSKSLVSSISVTLIVALYVALKFNKYFAVSGILTLAHDTIVVIGFLSFFNFKFDITVFAAILAIIGYTINDTIIIFDKIRFRLKSGLDEFNLIDLINRALSDTLSRTLMTSITTASVLISLVFLGGESLTNFAITLLVGVVVGTLSSLFLSTSLICLSQGGSHVLVKEKFKPSEDGDL